MESLHLTTNGCSESDRDPAARTGGILEGRPADISIALGNLLEVTSARLEDVPHPLSPQAPA
jgi:hypothetical protein